MESRTSHLKSFSLRITDVITLSKWSFGALCKVGTCKVGTCKVDVNISIHLYDSMINWNEQFKKSNINFVTACKLQKNEWSNNYFTIICSYNQI